jgi:hypothetical protein
MRSSLEFLCVADKRAGGATTVSELRRVSRRYGLSRVCLLRLSHNADPSRDSLSPLENPAVGSRFGSGETQSSLLCQAAIAICDDLGLLGDVGWRVRFGGVTGRAWLLEGGRRA